jgi:hypothetical protein
METITVAMIVYCVIFAGLVVGISIHRGIKRKREMRAFAAATKEVAPRFGSGYPSESPAQTDSPHDTPSAKHAA